MLINNQVFSEPEKLLKDFRAAKPFPHLVIDQFIESWGALNESFPESSWTFWRSLGDVYQRNKFTCSDIAKMPESLRNAFHELSSPSFLHLLEKVTGIEGLIPDPYLEGGGLHLSLGGGQLTPHTDFHVYEKLGLFRRLNLIVYLSENWQSGDGGELELSTPGDLSPMVIVEPIGGRAVIFETTDTSVHGFRNLVREGTCRPSLAVYYYTSYETDGFSGDQTTHWRDHGNVSWHRRPRFLAYKVLMKVSRLFSIAAHVVNPNQGLGLLRSRLKERNSSTN